MNPTLVFTLLATAISAQQPGGQINSPEALASPGTGKYGAHFFNDSTLAQKTIYQPKEIPAGFKAPILVWGNGGCLNVGTIMAPFLLQLASQGIVVIANGPPLAGGTGDFASFGAAGRSSYKNLLSSLDWVDQNAGKGKWAHLDPTRVAAAGQSCGGGEAYGVENDKRVKVVGIFNSGGMTGMGGASASPSNFKKPIFYFLGGPKDLAYKNGKGDYAKLPAGTPAWLGNWAPTGHGGTYNQLNGGAIGILASTWVNWVLRGDVEAGKKFQDTAAVTASGWSEVESKSLDKFTPPSPL